MTQFDATARINVDLSGFARAAAQSTSAGGSFTTSIRSLQTALTQVEGTNKRTANTLMTTLNLYKQLATVVNTYASAVNRLAEGNNRSATNQKRFNSALETLSGSLNKVTGLSKQDAEAKQRELRLYQQLASAVNAYVSALQKMAGIQSRAVQLQNQQVAAQQRAEASAQRLAQQQQALALAEQRLALQQQRLQQQSIALANAQSRQAQATNNASTATTNFSHSTFALRSTVGELEQGFTRVLAVLTAIPTAAAAAAISQEQAFAQVARVVGEAEAASAGLLESFQNIAQNFPISFEEVARIGQLGAQIGISANELDGFTQTVARFSLTTGIAAEESTLLLGRIAEMQNVPISEIENLGSAILALGTASAATDQEILRVNESIATASNIFGLTTEATSGLAAAMATLRVRPELARGSLTRVFGQLRDAVEQGGDSLNKLSEITNLTQKELVNLYSTDTDRFFLTFIKGLSDAAANGESFRNVLGEIGIGAVRDIDTLSRLGNNYDVLAESVDMAYTEYAKGTELQRQSQGIFDTTAARLQNLNDAFKNFLATAGKPLAEAVGVIAKALSNVLEFITDLGPVVPILGAIATGVAVGGAAWAGYQVILSKTLQSVIAMRELQNNLGVTTLRASTVIRAWRGELIGAAQGATTLNVATRQLVASASQLSVAATSSAASAGRLATANTAAALTTSQLATRQTQAAGQMTLLTARQVGLNTATAASVPALTSMSAAMQRAVATGNALNISNAAVTASQRAAATSATAAATATTAAGTAARFASFAFGPWGLAIAGVGLVLAPLLGQMFDFESQSDKVYKAALQQSGGLEALTNAIKADTAAAKEGGTVYRKVAVTKDDVSAADRRSAEAARDSAEARIREIELTAGSVAELQKQAKGHDTAAKAAQRYLREIEDANGTIAESNALLEDNVAAIGDQTRAWLINTAQAAANASGISSNKDALKQLELTGVDVGKVLTQSLKDPEGAIRTLDKASRDLQKTIQAGQAPGLINTKYGQSLIETASNAATAKEFVDALNKSIKASGDQAAKDTIVQQLLGAALDDMGNSAEVSGGKVKLTSDNLEDLELSGDEAQAMINDLSKQLAGFGTAFDAFEAAATGAAGTTKTSTEDAAKAVENFSLKTKTGFNAYLKELEKIATAQRNWATNLIKISATLGPGIANELSKLGPEAAPFIDELANLSADKLRELKPRLEAVMGDNVAGIAASILKGQEEISNASASTANLIANVLAKELGSTKNTAQFIAVIDKYGQLIEDLKKHKGEIDIDNTDAFKSIDDIINYIKLSEDKRLFDPKGRAELKSELFKRGAFELLDLVIQLEKAGAFDPDGKATLDPTSYNKTLGSIQDGVYRAERNGSLNPDGKANLTNGNFYAKLEAFRRDSASTGRTIQANLTRSATVSVGYYYYNKNTPPSTAYVKDGGWISGPGGPRDDRVPAMLSNGEFVVNAKSAAANAELLEAINNSGRGQLSSEVNGLAAKMAAISSGGRPAAAVARVPERAAALSTGLSRPAAQTVINVTNYYPQAEPTSKTVNRSLAFASALDGTT